MNAQSGRIFTISNGLSFVRVLLVWPIVVSLMERTQAGDIKALGLMLLAAATDYFDGYLARKLNQKSDLGRVIDPLADKIAVIAVSVALMMTHDLPLWFLILIIVRDLAILLLGFFMISHTKNIPESNWAGKVTVTAVAVVLIVFTLSLDAIKWFVLIGCVATLLISTISYFKRFIEVMFLQKS